MLILEIEFKLHVIVETVVDVMDSDEFNPGFLVEDMGDEDANGDDDDEYYQSDADDDILLHGILRKFNVLTIFFKLKRYRGIFLALNLKFAQRFHSVLYIVEQNFFNPLMSSSNTDIESCHEICINFSNSKTSTSSWAKKASVGIHSSLWHRHLENLVDQK